jgi:aminopeptidase C
MFTPDDSGRVRIGGDIAGGHEWVLIGVNTQAQILRATNSWGVTWGNSGHFTISYADYERLLHEDGDATVFVK